MKRRQGTHAVRRVRPIAGSMLGRAGRHVWYTAGLTKAQQDQLCARSTSLWRGPVWPLQAGSCREDPEVLLSTCRLGVDSRVWWFRTWGSRQACMWVRRLPTRPACRGRCLDKTSFGKISCLSDERSPPLFARRLARCAAPCSLSGTVLACNSTILSRPWPCACLWFLPRPCSPWPQLQRPWPRLECEAAAPASAAGSCSSGHGARHGRTCFFWSKA